jgi:hypothetical protein
MHNDPDLNGKYLGTITRDFVKIADTLKEAAYQVKARKFSDYPIFPISKEELPIGQLLLAKQELQLEWNYYITFLDELVQRQIIAADKVEDFQANYKNPEEFCCLFVVDGAFTSFVFVPFPEDS